MKHCGHLLQTFMRKQLFSCSKNSHKQFKRLVHSFPSCLKSHKKSQSMIDIYTYERLLYNKNIASFRTQT